MARPRLMARSCAAAAVASSVLVGDPRGDGLDDPDDVALAVGVAQARGHLLWPLLRARRHGRAQAVAARRQAAARDQARPGRRCSAAAPLHRARPAAALLVGGALLDAQPGGGRLALHRHLGRAVGPRRGGHLPPRHHLAL
eukprot:6198858-Pleurochrysis_carterae.AAC.5